MKTLKETESSRFFVYTRKIKLTTNVIIHEGVNSPLAKMLATNNEEIAISGKEEKIKETSKENSDNISQKDQKQLNIKTNDDQNASVACNDSILCNKNNTQPHIEEQQETQISYETNEIEKTDEQLSLDLNFPEIITFYPKAKPLEIITTTETNPISTKMEEEKAARTLEHVKNLHRLINVAGTPKQLPSGKSIVGINVWNKTLGMDTIIKNNEKSMPVTHTEKASHNKTNREKTPMDGKTKQEKSKKVDITSKNDGKVTRSFTHINEPHDSKMSAKEEKKINDATAVSNAGKGPIGHEWKMTRSTTDKEMNAYYAYLCLKEKSTTRDKEQVVDDIGKFETLIRLNQEFRPSVSAKIDSFLKRISRTFDVSLKGITPESINIFTKCANSARWMLQAMIDENESIMYLKPFYVAGFQIRNVSFSWEKNKKKHLVKLNTASGWVNIESLSIMSPALGMPTLIGVGVDGVERIKVDSTDPSLEEILLGSRTRPITVAWRSICDDVDNNVIQDLSHNKFAVLSEEHNDKDYGKSAIAGIGYEPSNSDVFTDMKTKKQRKEEQREKVAAARSSAETQNHINEMNNNVNNIKIGDGGFKFIANYKQSSIMNSVVDEIPEGTCFKHSTCKISSDNITNESHKLYSAQDRSDKILVDSEPRDYAAMHTASISDEYIFRSRFLGNPWFFRLNNIGIVEGKKCGAVCGIGFRDTNEQKCRNFKKEMLKYIQTNRYKTTLAKSEIHSLMAILHRATTLTGDDTLKWVNGIIGWTLNYTMWHHHIEDERSTYESNIISDSLEYFSLIPYGIMRSITCFFNNQPENGIKTYFAENPTTKIDLFKLTLAKHFNVSEAEVDAQTPEGFIPSRSSSVLCNDKQHVAKKCESSYVKTLKEDIKYVSIIAATAIQLTTTIIDRFANCNVVSNSIRRRSVRFSYWIWNTLYQKQGLSVIGQPPLKFILAIQNYFWSFKIGERLKPLAMRLESVNFISDCIIRYANISNKNWLAKTLTSMFAATIQTAIYTIIVICVFIIIRETIRYITAEDDRAYMRFESSHSCKKINDKNIAHNPNKCGKIKSSGLVNMFSKQLSRVYNNAKLYFVSVPASIILNTKARTWFQYITTLPWRACVFTVNTCYTCSAYVMGTMSFLAGIITSALGLTVVITCKYDKINKLLTMGGAVTFDLIHVFLISLTGLLLYFVYVYATKFVTRNIRDALGVGTYESSKILIPLKKNNPRKVDSASHDKAANDTTTNKKPICTEKAMSDIVYGKFINWGASMGLFGNTTDQAH